MRAWLTPATVRVERQRPPRILLTHGVVAPSVERSLGGEFLVGPPRGPHQRPISLLMQTNNQLLTRRYKCSKSRMVKRSRIGYRMGRFRSRFTSPSRTGV